MGNIVYAFGSSHAFTFLEPDAWDDFRARNRQSYQRRYGVEPPEQPGVDKETPAANQARFESVRAAHANIRRDLVATRPDVLIVVGDDQNELFTAANLPQLALYVGGDFTLSPRYTKTKTCYRAPTAFAREILKQGVAAGFDIASLGAFPSEELPSHAHAQVLEALLPDAAIPVLPVFLNAIHYPAVEPRRCYAFGEMLARAIAARPAAERVALCASGGWSHFTAGYPWSSYHGPYAYGAISEAFDRRIAEQLSRGHGRALAELSSADLLAHGDIELRAWITVLGAIGDTRPQQLVYESFYRAIMGMAVASWVPDVPA